MDGRRAGDGDIGRTAQHSFEYVLAIADIERESDVGVLIGERPHQRRDERLRGGRHRCDLQPTGSHGTRLARGAAPILKQANHVRRVWRKRDARFGETDSSARALEQVASDLSLKGS